MSRILPCLALISILTGCAMFGGSNKPRRDFPSWASAECYGALNGAKGIINKVGKHKISEKSYKASFVPGQKCFSGQWGWLVHDPSFPPQGLWVVGLCSRGGALVQVGIDPARPTDPAAINIGTLTHETGHSLLESNGHHVGHDPAYDAYFDAWSYTRSVVGKSRGSMDIYGADGTHYDVVK